MSARDVVVTGIGLASSLGEGADAHWRILSGGDARPVIDATRFPPYVVHPLPEIDWNLQIAKRGDQRQMDTWQRLGVYVAGLALDDAGLKGDEGLRATMDMIVAAAGGERDLNVDNSILESLAARKDRELLMNEKFTTELRPTLFLSQLSNLMAGNISIVHNVIGSSRTFLGEEGSGISALETAAARIRSGASTHALVGGAFQTELHDMLLGYEMGGYLHRGPWKPVLQRQGSEGGGVVSGSGGAFLVIESREHAEKRGRQPYAVLERVVGDRARRKRGELPKVLAELVARAAKGTARPLLAVSGASGAHVPTVTEHEVLAQAGIVSRGFGTLTGHLKEAQFPFAVGLAALAVRAGVPYPVFDAEREAPFDGDMGAVLATAVGYHQFEGAALLTAAG